MSSKEPLYDLLGDRPKKKIQIKRKPKKPPLPPNVKGIRRNPATGKLQQSTLRNPTYGMLTPARPAKPTRAAPKPKKVIPIKKSKPKKVIPIIKSKPKKVIQIKREPKKKVIKIKKDGLVRDPNTGRLRKKEIVGKKVRGGVKNVDVSKGKVLSKAPMTEGGRKKQLAAIAIALKNKAIEEGKIEGKVQKKKVIQIKREPKKKVIQIKREPKKKVIQIKRDKPPLKPPLPPYAKDLMRDASGKLVKKNIKAKIQKAKEAEKKAAQKVNTLKEKIKKARAEEKKAKTEAKKNTLKEKIKKAKAEEKKAKAVQKEVKKAASIIKAAPKERPKIKLTTFQEQEPPNIKELLDASGKEISRNTELVKRFYNKDTGKTSNRVQSLKLSGNTLTIRAQDGNPSVVGVNVKSFIVDLKDKGTKAPRKTKAQTKAEKEEKSRRLKEIRKELGIKN